jgi:hypothetical protein
MFGGGEGWVSWICAFVSTGVAGRVRGASRGRVGAMFGTGGVNGSRRVFPC